MVAGQSDQDLHSTCIFWMHYSMVKTSFSNFITHVHVVTTIFFRCLEFFGFLW